MARKKAIEAVDNVTIETLPVEEMKKDEVTKEVKTSNEKVKLVVTLKGGFTDKYTNVKYKENQEIEVDKVRAKELLEDERNLVTKK